MCPQTKLLDQNADHYLLTSVAVAIRAEKERDRVMSRALAWPGSASRWVRRPAAKPRR